MEEEIGLKSKRGMKAGEERRGRGEEERLNMMGGWREESEGR